MNKKGTRALASATVVGLVLATVATGNVKAAPGDVNKVQGNDRYETAANVAKANWKDGAKDVIIASGNGYADSLSASVLAKKLNAPIILTTAGELNSNAKSALQTLKPENVYVIGGNASVSQAVRDGLKKDYKVTELGGKTRFETNLAVANHLVDKLGVKADNVMVVNGQDGFSDALSAAPVAAAKEQVLLIVGRDASTADLAANFVKKHNSKVTVIGTEGVVPTAVYNKLGASERVNGGADRFDTNLKIMEHFKLNADNIYVANATDGQNGYADALVASALAGKSGAPLVLVDTKDAQGTKNAIKYIADNKTDKTEVSTVGGSGVMPDEIVNEIETAVNPELSAAEKAVKAYEDAKIGTSDEIAAAKALKADAVKAVDNVKDATKKSAFEARIAAKDKAISDAEAKMEVSVQSIDAVNLNQVKVVFTQKVDSDAAEDVANYEIGGKKLTEDNAKAVLQDDDRTVILTLADAQDQHDEVTVKVKKGILSEDKTKNIKEYEKDVEFKDVDAPQVSKVSVRGNNKLVIEFSEAILVKDASNEKVAAQKLADKFEINGQSINGMGLNDDSKVKDSLISGNNAYVNKVEFYFDSALDSGKNELKVLEGIKDDILCDVAGFIVKEAKFDFNVDKVDSKPEVKSVKGGTDGKIYIDFDRAMDTETALDKSNYELNNKSLPDDAVVELKKDDTQVKISNVSDKIKTGSNTIEIKDKVEDAYGNKVDDNTRISFKAEKDEEKPRVINIESIDAETIRVRFSEDVKYSNATNKSNYELKDSNGIDITNSDIKEVVAANGTKDDTNVYDIKMNKKLTGSKYTLKVKNIADTSDNVMDDYENTFKGEDDEAPTVIGVSQMKNDEKNKVVVRFSERMDRSSVRNSSNYRFIDKSDSNKIKDLPSKTTVTVASDDKTVTIEFPDSYKEKIGGIIVKSDVKDLAGNKMEADYTNKDLNSDLEVSYVDKSFKAKRSGDNVEVELQFDAALDKVDVNKFTFGDKKTTPDSRTINGDRVTFKFNDKEKGGENKAEEIKKLGANLTVSFTADAATDKSGQNIKPENNIKVYDYFIAPELDPKEKDDYVDNKDWKVEVNGDEATITISFDTEIANLGKAYIDDFKFMADNTGDELKVNNVEAKDGSNTLKYTFEDINKLKDAKSITVKADKDNIDVRTNKDGANNDQRYKPTNDDINGWKLQIGDDVKKAIAEKDEAKKNLITAIENATKEAKEAVVGTAVGNYAQNDVDSFKAEIAKAQTIADKKDATKAELDKAAQDLASAKTEFEGKAVKAAATLDSIAIKTQATKLTYKVGEKLDITGLVVEGTYSDGSKKPITIEASNVTGFDSSAVAAGQTLTITVDGKTTTYNVDIEA
ncbi:cell wall-binding repeat-containing protein [Clostridium botulinum]|uniref:cell wall-binding repeat-containing protein n=1 Tax=Clostridium botulinum TaxID=1491 RepID=UPI00096BDB30|nr:cell wall-binding repeat-containing protein [Clostridium botulinum]